MDFSNLPLLALSVLVGLLAGLMVGAGGYAWWLKRQENAEQPLPEHWNLAARGLMTSEEHEVMSYLRRTFPKHLVMIKLPVVRYTIPLHKDQTDESLRLQKLLDGVYCSFAVASVSGNVVGCVDVPGKRGLPRGNRDLKESLLSECGIPYTVVRGFDLPMPASMRTAFLGEMGADDVPVVEDTRGGDSNFHAELDAFTVKARREAKRLALEALNKNSDAKRLPAGAATASKNDGPAHPSLKPNRFKSDWQDSFIHPDSRPAKLDKF